MSRTPLWYSPGTSGSRCPYCNRSDCFARTQGLVRDFWHCYCCGGNFKEAQSPIVVSELETCQVLDKPEVS